MGKLFPSKILSLTGGSQSLNPYDDSVTYEPLKYPSDAFQPALTARLSDRDDDIGLRSLKSSTLLI